MKEEAKTVQKGKISLAQIKAAQQKKLEEKKLEMKRVEEKQQEIKIKMQKAEENKRKQQKMEKGILNAKEKVKIETKPVKDGDEKSDKEIINKVEEIKSSLHRMKVDEKEEEKMPEYKSPICCVLGHVDTGKTKLLDKLRETNVQVGEAGGITQQIGATFFPIKTLKRKCGVVECELPGILVIDTPGHESFTNLRSRGSSLCNLAILVVDIVHGVEKQTLESIKILLQRNTPFIIALNKIDRIYGWEAGEYGSVREAIEGQPSHTQSEFQNLLGLASNQLLAEGVKAQLFYENKNPRRCVSIVPTSAITGEGIADMVRLILDLSNRFMKEKMRVRDETVCTVLEVKATEGFGITVDAVLSNGELRVGDKIGLCGSDEVIVTVVKGLLVPAPMKELRLKSQYRHVERVYAAIGIKIAAPGMENAIAGSRIYVIRENEEEVVAALYSDLAAVTTMAIGDGSGVVVAASTLGSMEALLAFLRSVKIPVCGVSLGCVKRKDIIKAAAMADRSHKAVLCFNMAVGRDIELFAESSGVKIFTAEIIYHLIKDYEKFVSEMTAAKKKEHSSDAIFPVELKVLPNCVFTTRSPLVLGVEVLRGTLKIGTPLCVFTQNPFCELGSVVSILDNKKPIESANQGAKVAIKVELEKNRTPRVFGRHFKMEDHLYSLVTRGSIDLLKEYFKDELSEHHLELLIFLKNKFAII